MLAHVSKSFGTHQAVYDVTLDIARGEFFCLLGASGSGKTTLLRMIAGFESPDSGRIHIEGAEVTREPPYRRPVNMMFQSYALFPHLTVGGNVAFGLREEGRPKAEIRRRVSETLDLFGMGGFETRKPHQLSGGQRQRVALARALVKEPKILLLDEPLAALDKNLRERAQQELIGLRERLGITFVMVTHDQDEAMSMATRIALMRDGAIVETGTPHRLYLTPETCYTAGAFGAANLFAGKIVSAGLGEAIVDSAEGGGQLWVASDGKCSAGQAVTIMVRPEHMRLSRMASSTEPSFQATVESVAFLGKAYACHLRLETGKAVQAHLSPAGYEAAGAPQRGETLFVSWPVACGRILFA